MSTTVALIQWCNRNAQEVHLARSGGALGWFRGDVLQAGVKLILE